MAGQRAAARYGKKATPAQVAVVALGFAAMGAIWFLLAKAFYWLHWFPIAAPEPFHEFRTKAGGFLIDLPAMVAAISPGLLVANFVARHVRRWGRVLDQEAQDVPGRDYGSAQKGLAWASLVIFAIMLPIMIAGVFVGR